MADLIYGLLGIFGMGHPMHPVIVHMVIGPVIAVFFFFCIALWFKKPGLFKAAHWLTIFALVFWFFTVGMGVIDWIYFYGASGAMVEIAIKFALAGVLLFTLILAIYLKAKQRVKENSPILLIIYLISVLLCVGLGLKGGDIVYGEKKAGSESAKGDSVVQATATVDGFNQIIKDGFDLQWKFNGALIDIKLSFATTGWVGVGFGHSGTMQGSSIFMGYIQKDGSAKLSDEFGFTRDKHAPVATLGSKDVITNPKGVYADGKTQLSFTIPRDAPDQQHVTLVSGDTITVILAAGPSDAKDDVTYHGRGKYAVLKVKL